MDPIHWETLSLSGAKEAGLEEFGQLAFECDDVIGRAHVSKK